MCDTEGNKRIFILDNLPDCQQPHQHIHLKEEEQVSWLQIQKLFFWKETSTYWKSKDKILIIFWYYLLAPVANLWRNTHLERYVPVLIEQSLFYQILNLITDLCLLLLSLKISIIYYKQGLIYKFRAVFDIGQKEHFF